MVHVSRTGSRHKRNEGWAASLRRLRRLLRQDVPARFAGGLTELIARFMRLQSLFEVPKPLHQGVDFLCRDVVMQQRFTILFSLKRTRFDLLSIVSAGVLDGWEWHEKEAPRLSL